MPEILTESFCERCGTRYTFESAAPKQKRLGRFKVLSQGFKNFVMSDDTSLDEAFAAARNDEEREAVTQQLDAFHKTFNFCMNCRQYTCSNCWNEAEGRCLTCAPHLGHDVLPAPFPSLETNGNGAGIDDGPRLDGLAWPTLDLPPETPVPTADLAWPEAPEASGAAISEPTAPTTREDGLPDWASLVPDEVASAPIGMEAAPPEPSDVEMLLAHPAAAPEEPQLAAEVADEDAVAPAPEPEAVAESLPVEPELAPIEPQPLAAESTAPASETPPAAPASADDRAAAAAAQTTDLLARFRPGQSIDAALEEYEAALAANETDAASEAEPVADVPAPEIAPEPVAAAHLTPLETEAATPLDEVLAEEPPLETEIAAAIAETEAEPAEAEPAEVEPAAAVEAAPAAAESEPAVPEPSAPDTPAPAAPADDRVEVPVWRIVAPETPVAADGHPAETSLPTAASAEPQWPQAPAWPDQESQVDVSFLAARLSRKPENDALWAASSRDVVAPLPQQPAPPAVQTCVSCGLSLSATARFCRRCGSRQGS
jgi:hypothetical protein